MSSEARESVKVVLRCRPFSSKEKADGHSDIVDINKKLASVTVTAPTMPTKAFTFDSVFDSQSMQLDIYNTTARQIVESVLHGYNGTVLAYGIKYTHLGQTGTGKTFSMEGINTPDGLMRGIIPNAISHIFTHISQASVESKYLVSATYLEIYNEEIRDLIDPARTRLDLKESIERGVYVNDLSSYVIRDAKEMDALIKSGNKNRSVGSTLMNATSSRSHSIFTITVETSDKNIQNGEAESYRVGKLHLVDLAGSERQNKTGASGQRLKEASKINLSLSALGNVISALVDGKSTHIPYRDSKLTRLLQDSLGGNAKTLVIATISPASYNYEETISTLRYASRAKSIKNKPVINEDPKDAMLREFQEEIRLLKEQLSEGSSFEESTEEIIDGVTVNKKKRNSKSGSSSERKLAEMKEMVMKEKQAILESTDLEMSHRNTLLQEAETKIIELEKERTARQEIALKLSQMEQKLLVGGVNILDVHEKQTVMLAKRALELEEIAREERNLQKSLDVYEETHFQIEEEFASLQDESVAKTKKLKKLLSLHENQKAELQDLRREAEREHETLLDTINQLSADLKFKVCLMRGFIPRSEEELIRKSAEYDWLSDTWNIENIELSGGNRSVAVGKETRSTPNKLLWDPMCVFPNVYLSYSNNSSEKYRRSKSRNG